MPANTSPALPLATHLARETARAIRDGSTTGGLAAAAVLCLAEQMMRALGCDRERWLRLCAQAWDTSGAKGGEHG